MKTYTICWNVGHGDNVMNIEASSLEEAEQLAFKAWCSDNITQEPQCGAVYPAFTEEQLKNLDTVPEWFDENGDLLPEYTKKDRHNG